MDCYIITHQSLQAGSIVECEPIGLLEQDEDGEIDHKILASLPGEKAEVSQELLHEMQDFIHLLFSAHPEMHVTVGRVLPREEALRHIHELREE